MSMYILGSKMEKVEPITFEVGKVYYFGGTVPASVIYITRISDYVYYIKLDDQLYSTHDREFRESALHLSASVQNGTKNMQKELDKLNKSNLNTLLVGEIEAILAGDSSIFDIPEYKTWEQVQDELRKQREIEAAKPKPKYIKPTDVAKLVRKKLKEKFPGHKFSVRTDKYSGGSSIDVSWIDGPTTKEVEEHVKVYRGASFDGMIDLKSHHNSTDPDSGELVSYGNDYIFCKREYSKDAIITIWRKTCEKWGFNENKATLKQSDYDPDHWWYDFTYEHTNDYQHEFNKVASETGFFTQPEQKEPPKQESNGVTFGEYKGHATISLPYGSKGFTFGVSKAQAILDNIAAIEQFVKDNS